MEKKVDNKVSEKKTKKLSFSEFVQNAGIANLTLVEKKSRYQKYIR